MSWSLSQVSISCIFFVAECVFCILSRPSEPWQRSVLCLCQAGRCCSLHVFTCFYDGCCRGVGKKIGAYRLKKICIVCALCAEFRAVMEVLMSLRRNDMSNIFEQWFRGICFRRRCFRDLEKCKSLPWKVSHSLLKSFQQILWKTWRRC